MIGPAGVGGRLEKSRSSQGGRPIPYRPDGKSGTQRLVKTVKAAPKRLATEISSDVFETHKYVKLFY